MLNVLEKLSKRKDLDVYIISGRHADFLNTYLGHLSINLIAEHGFKIRHTGHDWQLFKTPLLVNWKDQIRPYLEIYVRDTPGSFLEEKHSALVWHYRKSDIELGQRRAADLVGQLSEFVNNLPIEIHHGKKIVEVSSIDVGKGRVVESKMRENNYELALCVGDDTTDENMFKVPCDNLIKVKIGYGDTNAQYRWAKPAHVLEFLEGVSVS